MDEATTRVQRPSTGRKRRIACLTAASEQKIWQDIDLHEFLRDESAHPKAQIQAQIQELGGRVLKLNQDGSAHQRRDVDEDSIMIMHHHSLSESFLVLQVGLSFEQLEEFLDLVILLPFLNQVRYSDLAHLREQLPHKRLNFLIDDFVGDAEHLETGTDGTVNKKLQLDDLQPFHLIEVKHIE